MPRVCTHRPRPLRTIAVVGAPRSTEQDRGALRSAGRQARRSLTGLARSGAEAALAAHLASVAMPSRCCVGVYVSDDGEPNLAVTVDRLRSRGHSLALPVPAADTDDFSMEFQPWLAEDQLAPGRFAIPCPPQRAPVVPDVVLVPLVRFDAAGNRMGRGAGFYDRWLARHHAVAIGTAFEVQRADGLTPQPHDVAMRAIVTELGIRFVRPTGTR